MLVVMPVFDGYAPAYARLLCAISFGGHLSCSFSTKREILSVALRSPYYALNRGGTISSLCPIWPFCAPSYAKNLRSSARYNIYTKYAFGYA